MLKIETIEAKNFMSYDALNLDLRARGPLLIIGENLDSQFASSNGSGKSAISEAILWCLFGTTARKMLSDDVIKYDSNMCEVQCHVSIDETSYTVVRTRKRGGPDTLTLDGHTLGSSVRETQDALCELLRISPAIAVNTIVFGQNLTQFVSATDGERGKLLKQLLWLDSLQAAREKVRKDLRAKSEEKNTLLRTYASLETSQKHFEEELSSWEEFRLKEQRTVGEQALAVALSVESFPSNQAELLIEMSSLSQEASSLKELLDGLEYEERVLIRDVNKLKNFKESLDSLTQCPTCYQIVTTEHKQEAGKEWGSQINQGDEQLKEFSTQISSLKKRQREVVERYRELEATLVSYDYWEEFQYRNKLLKEGISRLKSLNDKKCKIEENLTVVKSKIREVLNSINIISLSEKQLSFWDIGFSDKGLPVLLLSKAVDTLNLFVSRYSQILAPELNPEFTFQRETSTGEKWGLNVGVFKDGKDIFKNLSGGERQRVNLAVSFALFDLLRTSVTQVSPIILDEVFVNLDETGAEKVFQIVQGLPVETVLVITHDARLANLFQETLTVRKCNGVSQII